MTGIGFSVFETAIGWAAIGWSDAGVVRVRLPDADASRARAAVRRWLPGAAEARPEASVAAAVERIVALLAGERIALTTVALDMTGVQPFDRRVYGGARAVPAGETTTYGALAERIGAPAEARAVGVALARNPFPIVVPCHRVVAADGRLGGFSAPGGVETKRRMLAIEGAGVAAQPTLFDPPRPPRRLIPMRACAGIRNHSPSSA